MTKILLLGEATQSDSLVNTLENNGYQIFSAKAGAKGTKIAWGEQPQLVILDLFLPDLDGFETCRRLREMGVPYILVTSLKEKENYIIKALEMGADDYLRYPIVPPILLAKLETLIRRNHNSAEKKSTLYDDGHLLVDLDRRKVMIKDKPVKLTPTEFRLLSILMRQAGRVVTHEELINEIWGTEKVTGLGSLKLYVHYLRQKIEASPKNPHYLLAEWGVGYRFKEINEPVTTPSRM